MLENRKIKKVFKSKPTLEGAGVHLRRVFGNSEVPLFDPFLMLDDFRNNDPNNYIKGFPWHPHRGIGGSGFGYWHLANPNKKLKIGGSGFGYWHLAKTLQKKSRSKCHNPKNAITK